MVQLMNKYNILAMCMHDVHFGRSVQLFGVFFADSVKS